MNRIISYTCLGLNVFLVFLSIYESKLQLPAWLSYTGQYHPVLLHVPIGILVILSIFLVFYSENLNAELKKLFALFLAISSVLTTILGFFLGHTGYDAGALNWHKYTGIIFSILCYIYYVSVDKISQFPNASKISVVGLLAIAGIAGHQGGSITHGEDFLSFKSKKIEEKIEAKTLFVKAIEPIFKEKCVKCHNNQKTKGELNMTSIALLIKGGKNGPIWKAGHPETSNFMKRALLPLEEKEHMPPKGNNQLTETEIKYLENWIKEGASTDLLIAKIAKTSFFYEKVKTESFKPAKVYNFAAANQSDIEKAGSAFLSIKSVATNSPALGVNFFVKSKYEKSNFDKLSSLKNQIVSINLAKMPVGDEVFGILKDFPNLEEIILNETNITGKGIESLLACKHLENLSMSNTAITANNLIPYLSKTKNKHVTIWSTNIKPQELLKFQHNFEYGYKPDETEKLKLNTPILVNESMILPDNGEVFFKHSLKGVDLKYALNDEVLDSIKSKSYTGKLVLNKYTNIKLMAVKSGWLASNILKYQFYKSNVKVIDIVKTNLPNPKHKGYGDKNLVDGQFGETGNQYDQAWEGYFGENVNTSFKFKPTNINDITIATLSYTEAHIFPPNSVEIYIKEKNKEFVLFKKVNPPQPSKMNPASRNDIIIKINKNNIEEIKVVAKPVMSLPNWLNGKGQKAWIYIDEVMFN